jgi:arabinofuranan 3-O-arabinosyltransferase
VSIDDEPVGVRVTGSTADLLALEPLQVELCDAPDDALALDEGEHILRTGVGREVGLDIDQLLLASAEGGDALPLDQRADDTDREPPTVEVVDDGRVSARVDLRDATEPFWLVLGQSYSDGWAATVEGGSSLGPPTLIDGYANGWYIDPAEHGDELTVDLVWKPQRIIWASLGASVLGLLACVAALVFGRRRERPVLVADADPPLLDWPPFTQSASRFSQGVAVAAAVGLGVFAVLNLPPPAIAAPLVAVAVYTAFRWPRGRDLLLTLAAGLLAVTGLFYVVQQIRHRNPPDFIWPQQFDEVHVLGLLVIFLLAAEVVRSILVTRRDAGTSNIKSATDLADHHPDGPDDGGPDRAPVDVADERRTADQRAEHEEPT